MSFIHHNKNSKSTELLAIIIEPILILCIKGSTIYELKTKMQRVIPLPNTILKKYLFYLIDYNLISYNGHEGVYFIEYGGFDLLFVIERERKTTLENIEDIVITLE